MTLDVQPVTPSRDPVKAGADLVHEILRAFKVRRLYDVRHPQRRESEELSITRIAALLEQAGPIDIVVENERLIVGGVSVHDQPEGRDSISFILYREGLRRLSFYPGLTSDELSALLDAVAAAALAGSEEEFDLLARLWERGFLHIRYAFVEQLDEGWAPPASDVEDAGEMFVLGRDEAAVISIDEDMNAADFLRKADPTLYFLDDEDMAALQRELEAEKERTLLHETMTCLREILMLPDQKDPAPILAAITDLHASYLEEGSYVEVMALHDVFDPYIRSERAGAAARAVFADLRQRTLDGVELERLAARLDAGTADPELAAGYYRVFGHGNLSLLLAGCGDIKRLCQHPRIAEAFKQLAREDAGALRDAILDDDPAVACPASYLAGLIADSMMIEPLTRALGADDRHIRREALLAVKHIGGARALEAIARLIDDADDTVRLYALRHVVAHRYAPALPRVNQLLADHGRSLTERRLLYEAYGTLGGVSVLDELEKRLGRRGLMRKTDPQETACVLVALGAVGTPAARALVEKAANARHALVQRTAVEVLESWGPAPVLRP